MRAFSTSPSARSSALLLLALIALAAASKAILFDTLDPDLFWHLRVAEQLHTDGIGPLVDRISFSSIRDPWTPYSWLAELFMHRVWTIGGFQLAVAMQALTIASLVGAIAWSARWACTSDAASTEATCTGRLATALASAAGAFLALPYLSFRPVLFALLLIAIVNALCWRDRRMNGTSRAIWMTLPLIALTINLHLFGMLGTMLVVLHVLARGQLDQRAIALSAGAIVAACCTPMLPGLLRTAWHYQQADPMVAGGKIAEMLPFWTGPLGMVSACVALLMLAAVARSWRSMSRFDWIAITIACLLLLRLGRFAPVFAIIVAPHVARSLASMLSDAVLARRPIQQTLAGIGAIGLVRVLVAFPWTTPLDHYLNRHAPPQDGYPTSAATFVEANLTPSTGRLINEFTWGGYLAWRLGDRFQVLLDGRTQLYTPQFWEAVYFDDTAARRATLDRARADAAIVPAGRSAFRDDLLLAGWRVAHDDRIAQGLLPPPQHAHTPTD